MENAIILLDKLLVTLQFEEEAGDGEAVNHDANEVLTSRNLPSVFESQSHF